MTTLDEASELATRFSTFRADWVTALGEVVYRFSQLEAVSIWMIEGGAPERFDVLAPMPFELRNKKARHVARQVLDREGESALGDDWCQLFTDLIATGGRRNDIVHNPLVLAIYTNDAGDFAIRDGVERLRERGLPLITLAEVRAFIEELGGLGNRATALRARTALAMMSRKNSA